MEKGPSEVGAVERCTAELHEDGPLREAIFQRLTKREQEHDGADKGIGVLIKIARAADVRGKPLP